MDGKRSSHLLELKDEIESNSEDLTLGAIDEMHQSLCSMIHRLSSIRSSRSGINKLHLDILCNIFTLAIYDSSIPERTALNISHVCRYWRKIALRSPTLWAFVDLNSSTSLIDLFMERSQNTPLTLIWTELTPYFLSCANSILSRLWSLIIHSTYSDFAQFHHAIHIFGLPPLQLRHLDISLTGDSVDDPLEVQQQLTDSVGIFHLQQVRLIGLNFAWLELPHNKLTYFTLANPINPPTLSQLLVFLSNCPVLQVLDLAFQDKNDQPKNTSTVTTPTTPLTMNELVLNLTTLRLSAKGPSSYDFIRQFSERIRIEKALSQFELNCNAKPRRGPNLHSPSQILGAVPSGIFSHLSNLEYLNIGMIHYAGRLDICAYATASDHLREPSQPCRSCPLIIRSKCINIDKSAILELIQNMPQIKHLTLRLHAWTLFISQSIDIHSLLPSLRSLKFVHCDPVVLNSLPATLKFKRLIFDSTCQSWFKSDALTDFVLRMGIEVLVLGYFHNSSTASEAISTLLTKGVDVVPVDYVSQRCDHYCSHNTVHLYFLETNV